MIDGSDLETMAGDCRALRVVTRRLELRLEKLELRLGSDLETMAGDCRALRVVTRRLELRLEKLELRLESAASETARHSPEKAADGTPVR